MKSRSNPNLEVARTIISSLSLIAAVVWAVAIGCSLPKIHWHFLCDHCQRVALSQSSASAVISKQWIKETILLWNSTTQQETAQSARLQVSAVTLVAQIFFCPCRLCKNRKTYRRLEQASACFCLLMVQLVAATKWQITLEIIAKLQESIALVLAVAVIGLWYVMLLGWDEALQLSLRIMRTT